MQAVNMREVDMCTANAQAVGARAVIFDMDGTLVDTERVSQAAWRRAARDFGIQIPKDILHAFVGCSIPDAMRMIDDEFGDPEFTVRLFDRRHEIFDATWEDELELKAGAREAIDAARDRGLAVALATSSVRERAVTSMERFGLMDLFDTAVFDEDIERHKPAPDVYLVTAARLDVDPSRCIAVEDSFNGVRAASAAGMGVVMVPDFNEPTPEIRELCSSVLPTLQEFPRELERLVEKPSSGRP